MLKVKGGKVYQHNKINSQGSYINTSNTICVISCADMSLTWAFHIFCTSQYRWIKYRYFFYFLEFILEVEVAFSCFDKAVSEDDE